jgi:hypothetical protein
VQCRRHPRERPRILRDGESQRQFLLDYVQRVVYNRYKVTVRGSVPIRPVPGVQSDEVSAPAFRIEGEIKGAMLHGRRTRKGLDDGPLTAPVVMFRSCSGVPIR